MNYPQDMGNLISLYLDEIEINHSCDFPYFLIKTSATILKNQGGINWIPVIVKQIAPSSYEVIGNSFVYLVAVEAGLKRVWCIIADDKVETVELSQILAREKLPKINLSLASRDEIRSALEYLIAKPHSVLKGVNLAIATSCIDKASRKSWQNLEAIIALKCGITKGKKLEALTEIFYLTPEILPKNDPAILNKMNVTNLRIMAKNRQIKGFSKMKKADLIKNLSI